tara:strand:- start:85 stop:300 length:216 start_codon:yes stop_codon:yes gene_type:complete
MSNDDTISSRDSFDEAADHNVVGLDGQPLTHSEIQEKTQPPAELYAEGGVRECRGIGFVYNERDWHPEGFA